MIYKTCFELPEDPPLLNVNLMFLTIQSEINIQHTITNKSIYKKYTHNSPVIELTLT